MCHLHIYIISRVTRIAHVYTTLHASLTKDKYSLYNIMITSSAKKNIARDMLIAIALSDAYREICVNARFASQND